jgi:hypothetical protein
MKTTSLSYPASSLPHNTEIKENFSIPFNESQIAFTTGGIIEIPALAIAVLCGLVFSVAYAAASPADKAAMQRSVQKWIASGVNTLEGLKQKAIEAGIFRTETTTEGTAAAPPTEQETEQALEETEQRIREYEKQLADMRSNAPGRSSLEKAKASAEATARMLRTLLGRE